MRIVAMKASASGFTNEARLNRNTGPQRALLLSLVQGPHSQSLLGLDANSPHTHPPNQTTGRHTGEEWVQQEVRCQ